MGHYYFEQKFCSKFFEIGLYYYGSFVGKMKKKVSDVVTYSWLLAPNYRKGKTVAEKENPGKGQGES